MATQNTGYLANAKLSKVTTDGTNRPLDDNNNLVSESGLPQTVKNNDFTDVDYVPPTENQEQCPLP